MVDKQKWMVVFLPFVAGFFGGIISILIFNPDTLFAEKQTQTPKQTQTTKQTQTPKQPQTAKQAETPKVLIAEEFRLVDKYGKTRATLKSSYTNDAFNTKKESQEVQLQLLGEKGEVQLTAGEFTSGVDVSQNDYTKDQKLHSSIHLFATGASSDIRMNYDQPVSKDPDPNNANQGSSEDMKIQLSVNSSSNTSNIRLYDNNSNERVNIGNAYVTKKDGTAAKYPASSIHLYRDDGRVLWYERE
jgi:hypothetical protein